MLTKKQLREAVTYLLQFDRFVIDVETTMDNAHTNDVLWVGIGGPGRVYMIPLDHPKGYMITDAHYEQQLPPDDKRKVLQDGSLSKALKKTLIPATFTAPPKQLVQGEVFEILKPLMFSDRIKIGHNLKFDILSVSKYYGEMIPGPYCDTILVTHCLDENRLAYDLKTTVMDWLRIPSAKRAEFYPNFGRKGVQNFAVDVIARYLAKDLRYTWLYCRNQYPRMAKQKVQAGFDLEMDLYPVLMKMESRGFMVDTSKLADVGTEMRHELAALAGAVHAIAGYQFDLTNLNTKRDLLFKPKKEGGQGLKPLSVTAKQQLPQLNKATLQHYAETNVMADLLLEWSELEKLNGTFVVGLTGHLIGQNIHTNFKQHGTVTTRMSAQEPNLQQIPARGRGTVIREMFVAGPGKMLVVADYDQVELRCAAWLSKDPEMMRVFTAGLDIHSAAAAAMYQIPIEDVTKDQRQVGKTMNFLTLYGGGAAKLARVAGVTIEEAQSFINRYYRQFKGLKAWKDLIIKEAMAKGERSDPHRRPPYVVIPPFGRRRRLPDLYSPHEYSRYRAERQAVNAMVQGFAASIMKLALIDLDAALEDIGAELLCTVHDEVIVRCDTSMAEKVKDVVTSVMSAVSSDGTPILGSVPLAAKANTGYSWADAK